MYPISNRNISLKIEPNYSSWQTIEYSFIFAKDAIDIGIHGDVVECGVACGNNFAAMCYAGRHGVGFDSFEGIPWAGEKDDQQPGIGLKTNNKGLSSSGITVHKLEDTHLNMRQWKIQDYEFVEGWFENTIPKQTATSKISVLRLDGDLYDSTMIPLIHLYPLLSKGGYLIIDDWNLKGCREAVHDYFKGKLPQEVFKFDNPVYFKK
jgi:hypothetical protein